MNQEKTARIEKVLQRLGSNVSVSVLARESGVSRPTVRKYLEQQQAKPKKILEAPKPDESLQDKSKRKLDELIDSADPRIGLQAAKSGVRVEDRGGVPKMTPEVQSILFDAISWRTAVQEGKVNPDDVLNTQIYEDTSKTKKT